MISAYKKRSVHEVNFHTLNKTKQSKLIPCAVKTNYINFAEQSCFGK